MRNDLRVVVELNAHDAEVAGRRIAHDVSEVAVEGQENRVQFLRSSDDYRIERANR